MVSESLARHPFPAAHVPRIDGNGRVMALEVLVNTPCRGRNCIREGKTYMLGGVMQTGKNGRHGDHGRLPASASTPRKPSSVSEECESACRGQDPS